MSKNKNVISKKSQAPSKLDTSIFYGMNLDKEQADFVDAIWDETNDIIFCNSKAGTGKTTIATGVANLLVYYEFFDNIIYIMAPYGEKKQGWLPGDITEKSSVYFEAFYQALVVCGINPMTCVNNNSIVNQKYGTGYITCITDTFLRGSNLEHAVVIIDEAQNCTRSQLKKILTRVTDSTKVIVIGHDQQCDLEDKRASGFTAYLEHFKGQERAAICELKTNHRGWVSRHADELPE